MQLSTVPPHPRSTHNPAAHEVSSGYHMTLKKNFKDLTEILQFYLDKNPVQLTSTEELQLFFNWLCRLL